MARTNLLGRVLLTLTLTAGLFSPVFVEAAVFIEICGFADTTCKPPDTTKVGDQDIHSAQIRTDGAGSAAVKIGVQQTYPGDVPPTWTVDATGAHPPSTATPTTKYGLTGFGSATFDTPSSACAQLSGSPCNTTGHTSGEYNASGSPIPASCASGGTPNIGAGQCADICAGGTPNPCASLTTFSISTNVTCPAGYSLSGSVCNLTNEALVMKPSNGQCGVIRTGNTITNDPRDPDCSGSGSTAAAMSESASGGVATASSGGKTLQVSIDNATGNVTITGTSPNSDGSSTVTSLHVSGSGSNVGTVTGTGTATIAGTGDMTDPTKTASVGACGGAGLPPCKLDETGTPTGTGAFDASKTAIEAVTPSTFGKGTWAGTPHAIPDGIPTISGSASCTNPPSVHIFGVDVIMDVCGFWSPLKSWLAWALYAITALYIWKRTMRVVGA